MNFIELQNAVTSIFSNIFKVSSPYLEYERYKTLYEFD